MSLSTPLIKGITAGFKPDPRMTVSEWADTYRVLTTESSAEAGRWRTSRTPYLKEIMDVLSPTDPTEQVVVIKGVQLGFCLALDTEVPTPDGWRTMRDLNVGDKVFDEQGEPTTVTYKSPVYHGRDCYKVVFDDGSEVIADDRHRWATTDGVVTTTELVGKRIALTRPVNYPAKELPAINPYLLGLWLANGHKGANEFAIKSEDYTHIRNMLPFVRLSDGGERSDGIRLIRFGSAKSGYCKYGHNLNIGGVYESDGSCKMCKRMRGKPAIRSEFEEFIHLALRHNKHIPPAFLTADIATRTRLLQALMDTDGYVASGEKRRCGYDSVSKQLILGVRELLHSLGYKTKLRYVERTTNYTQNGVSGIWRLTFSCINTDNICTLDRKRVKLKPETKKTTTQARHRKVISVTPTESVPVQCITVDSPSHQFLITRSYIPTHNTELGLNTALCYLDLYPCPILFIQPTETLAKGTSKRRLTPSIKAIPRLLNKITNGKRDKDVGEIYIKEVPGGTLTLAWSNSTASFRSFSARVVIMDDIDGFGGDFGEGNPIDLGKARADAFPNRKIYINSTPTTEQHSMIMKEFANSDQREYFMPCPHCGKFISFEWENFKLDGLVRRSDGTYRIKKEVFYVCPECGGSIKEHQKTKMMEQGKWIPQNPGHPNKGYRLPSFYSPMGWLSWRKIAIEFLRATSAMKTKNDPSLMQVWQNTRNARPFKEALEGVNITSPEDRIEPYEAEVPDDVVILLAGVDTQDNRFEVAVIGLTNDERIYYIDYATIPGDPASLATQGELDAYLDKQWVRPDGSTMKVFATGVDTGGHRTAEMYKYVQDRHLKKVFGLKGSNQLAAPVVNKTYHQSLRQKKFTPYMVGTIALKDDFYQRLSLIGDGPRTVHFPDKAAFDDEFFKMLTAEQRDQTGRYVKIRNRNEALDCSIYALVTLPILGADVKKITKPVLYVGSSKPVTQARNGYGDRPVPPPTSYLDEF